MTLVTETPTRVRGPQGFGTAYRSAKTSYWWLRYRVHGKEVRESSPRATTSGKR
jgi:hypothetical protein